MTECFVTIHNNTRQKIADYFWLHSIPYEERPAPKEAYGCCETVFYFSLKGTDVDNRFSNWLSKNTKYNN